MSVWKLSNSEIERRVGVIRSSRSLSEAAQRLGVSKTAVRQTKQKHARDHKFMGTKTHGHSRSPTYATWRAMLQRCHSQKAVGYKNYGAAGIRVCERWRKSFSAFLADMGPRPSLKHSIDRIDNYRGYEPGNCRWATLKEQALNKRDVKLLELNGEFATVADWARKFGIFHKTLRYRLSVGLTLEQAVNIPVHAAGLLTERARATPAEVAQAATEQTKNAPTHNQGEAE